MPIPYSGDESMVLDFFGIWEGGDIDAILSYFTPDASYIDMPLPPRNGFGEIRAYLENIFASFSVRIETLNIASRDNIIFSERIDYLELKSDASVLVPLPVTGVMEVRDGRIGAWRDYLDLRTAEEGLDILIRPNQTA